MLSVVITVLLFIVMLLIVASLIYSAQRERQRHRSRLTAHANLPAHPLDRHVTAVLHMKNGMVVNVERPEHAFTLPASWYTRRRALVSLGFLVMIILALFIQDGLASGPILSFGKGLAVSLFRTSATDAGNVQVTAHQTASARLVRVDSTDRRQYYTDYQWKVWSYASCSGIAMEMVMNAYGRHLIAADVLQKELDLGVWSVQLGLLRDEGIALTADYFGFNTDYGRQRNLQAVIAVANRGAPVIVAVRDAVYFPGGHLFVVRGGDEQSVFIADSSPANFQRMTHAQFSAMWAGVSFVLTPRQ
ncbi:MAG: hypothetical protein IMW89_06170 [Ktedonobacteraceae bacterium]|nr:hypothetical protein [Ktedonobacteraceae bacterium]